MSSIQCAVDVFPNEDENSLEDILDENGFTLTKPEGRMGRFRWICGYAVNYPWVQAFLMLCILLNCLVFGVRATDLMYDNPDAEYWENILDVVDYGFLVIFTVEIDLQFIYHGFGIFRDPWLGFDLVLVVTCWLAENMSFIKGLNVRGLRIVRSLRLFHIGPVYEMILAMTKVLPDLSIITLLIVVLLYIFAVCFTNLFKEASEQYFGRLDITLFTLLQMMTMSYSDPMRSTLETIPWAWVPFVGFLMVMGFMMFNLMVAVICDSVKNIGGYDDERLKAHRTIQEARYRLLRTSNALSGVASQQKNIEEHLREITQILLERENFNQEEYKEFVEEINNAPIEVVKIDQSEKSELDHKTISEDEIFIPMRYLIKQRTSCGKFVNSENVQKFIFVCICLNCAIVGLDATQLGENSDVSSIFEKIDKVFLVIFTVEISMQAFYFGYYVVRDAWLFLDLSIVCLSWALSSVNVVRGFRVLRALRVTYRVEFMKDIIRGLRKCIGKMRDVILLSLLIFYIFAVLFTNLYQDTGTGETIKYYQRLDLTMFTLLQIMTLDFATPMRETMTYNSNAWIPHILFVLSMGLVFFNLMTGVICDAICELEDEDDNKEAEEQMKISVQLRDLSYQVSIMSKSRESLQECISNLCYIVENKREKRRYSISEENISL